MSKMSKMKIGNKILAALKIMATRRAREEFAVNRATPLMSKMVDFAAKQRLAAVGENAGRIDYLVGGRMDKYAEDALGVRKNADGSISHSESTFTWLAQNVPADLRQPVLWDGRTPDGNLKAWLAFAEITAEDKEGLLQTSSKSGTRFAAILAASTFLLGIAHNVSLPSLPAPAWGDWISALPPMQQIHAYASGIGVWSVDVVGKLFELLTTNAWPVAACAILSAITFAFALKAGEAVALNKALQEFKRELIHDWTMQSQDSELLYHTETIKRIGLIKTYANAIDQALGWRKHMPVLQLGQATGLLRWRGLSTAPVREQFVCLDGISMRQNTMFLGGVGTGKTRDGLIPFAEGYFFADFNERDADGNVIREHKAGALIMDGKGKLASDMMKIIPAHRRIDVRLIGTEDGWWVMDITEGMSVDEIVELFILLAKQKAGSVENEQWINGSGNAFGAAGYLGRGVLEKMRVLVKGKDIWANRGCEPSSLLGMYTISTDFKLNQDLAQFVIDELEKGVEFDQNTIDAAHYFNGYWKDLAQETRSSFVSNINNTLGDLTQNKRLAERFAAGKNKNFPTARIQELFEGKIFLLALSEIADGNAGKTVANFIKQRAYLLAQKRLAESSKAEELLARVDDCRVNYDGLLERSTALINLEVAFQAVQFAEESADIEKLAQEFTRLFPNEEFIGAHRAQSILNREMEGVESKLASYTDDVLLMAHPHPDLVDESQQMIARYIEIRDYPKNSSVMVMIDEYQDYVTVGDGGKADSTFINKDRETGMFLVVATQTLHSLSKKIGHPEMMDMVPNFTNKVVFRVDDVETHEYLIKTAGTAFQSVPYPKNLFSNAYQHLDAIIKNRREISVTSRLRSLFWPNLKTDINVDDPFEFALQKIDIGVKAQLSDEAWKKAVHNKGDKVGVFEWRSQAIQEQEAIRQEIKDGGQQPLVSVDDLKRLEEGHAFVMWNRAGMSRQDFVYMRKH